MGGKPRELEALGSKVFEKLQHIPENLEGHVHAQGCAHTQERPEKKGKDVVDEEGILRGLLEQILFGELV